MVPTLLVAVPTGEDCGWHGRGTGEGGAAALDRRGATTCPGTLTALDALHNVHIPMEGSLKPSSCRPHPR